MMDNSVICAIATPPGRGAIAVARVSGEGAIGLCDRVVRLRSGKKLAGCPARTLHVGEVMDGESRVDEVVVSLFHAPRSFTGEECVEISCHGSAYVQQRLMQLLVNAGARLASPGEFTRRAFLNGKMDLPSAEAVMDLVAATSATAHEMAMKQMRGGFSRELATLREELLRLVSLVELELDFAEEDVTFADRRELLEIARHVHALISGLRDSFARGNVLKNGVPVAIAGPPNAGKSTLLNTLLHEERAIVSEREGTTRDVIEESLDIEGITFRFIDTAGLRESPDEIEQAGISRALDRIARARVVLLLVDAERLPSFPRYHEQVRANISPGTTLLLLLNKIDRVAEPDALVEHLRSLSAGERLLAISAKTGKGMDALTRLLLDTVTPRTPALADTLVSNLRHHEALTRAGEATDRLLTGLDAHLGGEFLAQDLRECLHYIGEITGEITTDEILGNIFKNFCIGK
jgi:tRNA modification GTPase